MARRIVSLWFPRLAAERLLRRLGGVDAPFAVVGEVRGGLRIASVSGIAEAAGVTVGMGLADARAIRPDLLTRPAEPEREAAFLGSLARWTQRYTPWGVPEGTAGLVLDITGCAHLFGGEAAMLEEVVARLAAAGLTAQAAVADTRGAAWALARFAAGPGRAPRTGDAIAADARATRVRAPARKAWAIAAVPTPAAPVIAPPGQTRAALGPLPVASLRIAPEAAEGLARLGLRTVGEVARLPRGAVARRFGLETVRRLDQALGTEPEPIALGHPAPAFAVRLSLPDPVGRVDDLAAALARLLARLCDTLAAHAMGARRLRLSLRRVDHAGVQIDVGLARPSRDPAMIAGLFAQRLSGVDAGFGIEALRLHAVAVEPLTPRQDRGPFAAEAGAGALRDGGEAFAVLLGRLGGRLGFGRLERTLPADSHIPARAFTVASAAHAPAPQAWPAPPGPRPIEIFRPEPIDPEPGRPPRAFRWRGCRHALACAFGPERIAPEWWLDDPAWRTGPRDYWRVETASGLRLWLFHAPRATCTDRWFAEGVFA